MLLLQLLLNAPRLSFLFLLASLIFHSITPREDFDMASYGVVKVFENRLGHTYPGMPWEPKAAFTTLADYYRG